MPGLAGLDDARAAGRARRDHRQAARHRLQRYIAEGFGHRRVEQHVARSERAGERLAALKTDEAGAGQARFRSEEHTSELQSLMRISYAVFCLYKKKHTIYTNKTQYINHINN